jgi:hypothetical protein
MLLTDSDLITIDSLLSIDSEAQTVAAKSSPAISLTGARSVANIAWREVASKISAANQTYAVFQSQTGVSPAHTATIANTGVMSSTQPRVRLSQVVAHDYAFANSQSPIQQFAAMYALYVLYRDASGRMDKNDRLQTKMLRFLDASRSIWSQFVQTGLPTVLRPLECPGALHAFNAGIWNSSCVSAAAGSGSAGSWDVAITYYDSSLYTSQAAKGNGESGPSSYLTVQTTAGQVITLNITGLIPPNGSMDPIGTSQGVMLPLTATHWNVYAGASGGPLWYQGSIPIATKTYTFAGAPVQSGTVLQLGQYPDRNLLWYPTVGRG